MGLLSLLGIGKRTYQHRVVVTYLSGITRKKYEGIDAQAAEQAFNAAKAKWLEDFTNILAVVWTRDGEDYKHV
jgi:hypothetical protein